jgi:hypothetical protein
MAGTPMTFKAFISNIRLLMQKVQNYSYAQRREKPGFFSKAATVLPPFGSCGRRHETFAGYDAESGARAAPERLPTGKTNACFRIQAS